MANWKYTLDVKNERQATKAGDMTIDQFAAVAANRIKALPPYEKDVVLFDIADELESIAADPDADVEWFDGVWSNLYDWADQVVGVRPGTIWPDKMCWIKTF
jgi:hypothetical protein